MNINPDPVLIKAEFSLEFSSATWSFDECFGENVHEVIKMYTDNTLKITLDKSICQHA